MSIVVCDAGPILHLSEAGALGLLERVGEILIPTAVDREVFRHIADWPTRRRVQSPPNLAAAQPAQWATQIGLGPGEIEAILLARSLTADWLLTDDAAARVVATLLAIEVHGPLGLVLWAAAPRQINRQEAAQILERLAQSSLWVSPTIVAEARRALVVSQLEIARHGNARVSGLPLRDARASLFFRMASQVFEPRWVMDPRA